MSTVQQQIAAALAILALIGGAVKYGRDQESADHERGLLRDRIRALERIEYSEHPEWAQAIYFATGEKPESK